MIPWDGTVYRASTYDVALWVRPNRRDGRFNRARVGCTQYFCSDPEAPYAEMIRHEGLTTEDEVADLQVFLWQAQLHESAIVDYSTFERVEAAGFPPEAIVEDDYERCQAEAEWLKSHNAGGVITPSAALPGSLSLTLFGPRVEVPWDATTQLSAEVPVQQVGSKGSGPPGLVARVRQFGAPHAGLDAYQAAVASRVRSRRPKGDSTK